MMEELNVALVGKPNCGKTSLFNSLTGLNQKVSNFPGTTVDKKVGFFKAGDKHTIRLVDLPGTYSLYPKSDDEAVTLKNLCAPGSHDKPDVVLFIADASNLKRCLMLYTQVADLGLPMVLALNMIDVADRKGMQFDLPLLQSRLGVEVIPMNARKQKGVKELIQAIFRAKRSVTAPFYDGGSTNKALLKELKAEMQTANMYHALLWAHNSRYLTEKPGLLSELKQLLAKYSFAEKPEQAAEVISRYRTIDAILQECTSENVSALRPSMSNKLDRIITHKYLGLIIFLLTLFVIFQSIFSLASYPMEWMETGMNIVSGWLERTIPGGILNDLLIHGIVAGLAGVIIFIPQIAILFLFISLLEDLGYMARVSFIMDRLMRPFGLNGKSVVPLISGMACAVPAIMSTRNIENIRERLITIMVIPLMSCSARLPVYTLLISMLVEPTYVLGFLNLQGLVLMGMYLLGFVTSLLSAMVFSFFLKNKQQSYFIMEMPAYKVPLWRNVVTTIYEKSRSFVVGAGKIIIAVSVVLWALSTYGPQQEMLDIESKYALLAQDSTLDKSALENRKSTELLEASFVGHFGKFIEPAIAPLGFNWKIGIALVTSLAAREVFVGTMTTIYSVEGHAADISAIQDKMKAETNALTGKPQYGPANVLSLMVFYAFAMQCMSTLAVTFRETRSRKWTLIQLGYLSALAYLASLAVYQFFS